MAVDPAGTGERDTVQTPVEGGELNHLSIQHYGHCAFWLEDCRVLFAGDALQKMDPLRGQAVDPEPEQAANFDDEQAMASARNLASLGQVTLLPGHGHPWEGDIGAALSTDR